MPARSDAWVCPVRDIVLAEIWFNFGVADGTFVVAGMIPSVCPLRTVMRTCIVVTEIIAALLKFSDRHSG